jgi:GNAT superfamily N-acetyltransferase
MRFFLVVKSGQDFEQYYGKGDFRMENTKMNRRLLLIRPHLDEIPAGGLPSGFSLRPLTGTEDADNWLALIRAAERLQRIESDTFTRAYGTDDRMISERVYFLLDSDEKPVGTVAAWQGSGERADWGRIHWLYILPEYQGKGLGRALLTFALHRLRELGHTRVYLTTDTGRPDAVHLYHALGFVEEEGS